MREVVTIARVDTKPSDEKREAVGLPELIDRLSQLPPDQAAKILARARPVAERSEPENVPPPPPHFGSWKEFLDRTTESERLRWCTKKAKKANGNRLMSGPPDAHITGRQVLTVLEAAGGRCHYCHSLAVENRPSKPNGAPAPWASVGRRIGSLGHVVGRIHGGSNKIDNLVWCCLWCNTWQQERRAGATDHGGLHPVE